MRSLQPLKSRYGLRQVGRVFAFIKEAEEAPLLFVRMAAWSLVLYPLKTIMPVGALARLMWAAVGVEPRCPERERVMIRLAGLIYRRRSHRSCLERSLLLYRFLSSARANPQLIIGLKNLPKGWEGHAWVIVDDQPVGESVEALRGFAPLFLFGPDGKLQLL